MKKLMVAAAIVCAAAYAKAGSFIWGIETYENEAPTADYDDGGGYFNGAGTAVLWILGTEGWQAVADSPMDEVSYYYGNLDPDSPSSDARVNALVDGDDTANLQQWKIVLTTDDGMYTATWTGSGENYTVTGTGEDVYIQVFKTDTPKSAGEWVAVPEPTSGLLLLLGVAGLALRRRRA